MHFSLAGVASAPNTAPLTIYSWEGYSDEAGTPVTAYTTVPTLAAGVTLYGDPGLGSYYFNAVTDTFVYGNYVYPDAGDNQTIKGEYLKLTNPWAISSGPCYTDIFTYTYYVGGNAQYFNGSLVFSTWYEDPLYLVTSTTFFYDPYSYGYVTERVDTSIYGYANQSTCEPPT